MFQEGVDTAVKLLEVRVVSADERTARKLCLAEGDNAIYIRRLLTRAGQPIFYHRAYLVYDPTRPIVDAEMDVTSLHGLFSNAVTHSLKRGQLTIEATLMNEEEANILQTKLPTAAFYLEHLFYDFEERPLSWGWCIFRSDDLRFATEIGIQAGRKDA